GPGTHIQRPHRVSTAEHHRKRFFHQRFRFRSRYQHMLVHIERLRKELSPVGEVGKRPSLASLLSEVPYPAPLLLVQPSCGLHEELLFWNREDMGYDGDEVGLGKA